MVLRVGFTVVVGFTGMPSDIEEVKFFGSFERAKSDWWPLWGTQSAKVEISWISWNNIRMDRDGAGLRLSTLLGHLHQHLFRQRHQSPQQEQLESWEACFAPHQSFSILSLLRFDPALNFFIHAFRSQI